MGRERRAGARIIGLFALGLLLLHVPLQEGIHKERPDVFDPNRPNRSVNFMNVEGPTMALVAALGGFRTVAADLLWIKVDQMWDGGNWWALPPLLESVVDLDPQFILAWKVYGWHLAYNLNAESTSYIDKQYWLAKGLKVLQRGVEMNPKSPEMAFELGWTYFDRAHEYYRAADIFKSAGELPGAQSYLDRFYYRCYEHLLDIPHLGGALAYARSRLGLPQFAGDNQHQRLVRRDSDFWATHWNDPMTHRRIIVEENTARQQRALPFYLYPNDPYWIVCKYDGMPSKKGSKYCEFCGRPLPKKQTQAYSDVILMAASPSQAPPPRPEIQGLPETGR